MYRVDKNKLSEIENDFSAMRVGSYQYAEESLSNHLSDVFNKNISVQVIKSNEKKNIFVMCVLPEKSIVDKVTMAVMRGDTGLKTVSSLWQKCNNWTVQIDEKICNTKFTNRELTGLTLHEVGHIMDTNSVLNRLNSIMQFTLASASAKDSRSLSSKIYSSIAKLPVIQACMYGNSDSLKKELKADKFASDLGYTTDLVSAMNKIESLAGTKLRDSDKGVELMTNFSLNTVHQLQDRKANLVKYRMNKLKFALPNNFLHESVDEFCDNHLSRKDEDIYSYADMALDKEYFTEFLGIGKVKLDRITQMQVDYVAAKIDTIQNADDKIMLLTYVNSKIELCDYYMILLDNPNASKKYIVTNGMNELLSFKSQLCALRIRILNYRIKDPNKLVVYYPDKYNG